MDHRPGFPNLGARYDDFLFATVCDDANGTQLSVLSALARIDVDPWEEAGRLAAMPQPVAARTLVAILDQACGANNNPLEAEAMAARLLRLLPQAGAAAAPSGAPGTASAPLRTYWWVWGGLGLALAVISPHHMTTTSPTMAQTESGQPAATTGASGLSTAAAVPAVKDAAAPAVKGSAPLATPAALPGSVPIAFSR